MAQLRDTARFHQRAWAGTISSLRSAAEYAAGKIASTAPEPEAFECERSAPDYTERYGDWLNATSDAKQARSQQITILEDDGFSRELSAVQDLSEFPSDKLNRIAAIEIRLGSFSYHSVSIKATRLRGLEVEIRGPDRAWTAGVRHEIEDRLTPAEPLALRIVSTYPTMSYLAAFYAGLALFYGLAVYFKAQSDWAFGVQIGVAGLLAVTAFGSFCLMTLRLPTMELLREGQRPAYARRRAQFVSAAVALALSVAGSLLIAAFM